MSNNTNPVQSGPLLEPIPHKTTISIMNLVITRATDFINKFYTETEKKMLALEQRVEKLDALLTLLEKKLDSVPQEIFQSAMNQPQMGQQVNISQTQPLTQQVQTQIPQQMTQNVTAQVQTQIQNNEQPQEEKEPEVDLEREKYLPYIKAFKIGIPLPALRIKMQVEGVDPAGIEKYVDVSFRP